MGTSKSSSGPGARVPMVPDFLDVPSPAMPVPGTAPPQRFNSARRHFGRFVEKGELSSLGKALGSYVRSGYGGGRNAALRMGQAATTAARVYQTLSGLADGSIRAESLGFDASSLDGATMEDIIDAIVDVVCKGDTTLDDESGRLAAHDAMIELMTDHPDADPMNLPPELIEEIFLQTLANHVFENIRRDIGASLQGAARGDAARFNAQCKEMRQFVLESFREQLGDVIARGGKISSGNCDEVARKVTAMTMDVYQVGEE